jgi:F-type H+-transporting ATPase subunit a
MEEAENPIVIPTHLFAALGFGNFINPYSMSLLAFAIIFILMTIARSNPQLVPTGVQNFIEMVMEFVQGMADSFVGKQAPFFFPLFYTLFMFIFFADLIGLIPGLVSPTSRVDINLGMALIVFLSTHYWGIKEKGWKYFEHFLPPSLPTNSPNFLLNILMMVIQAVLIVLMPVIHLIGELVKPFSLTLRLFGNMMAKEKLLAILVLLITIFWNLSSGMGGALMATFPFLLRVAIVILGVLVCFIQAFVFMLLSMAYIGGAVQSHEGHEENGEDHGHAAA